MGIAKTFDIRALRGAFGQFATGVTIVTSEHDGAIRGMTANSFTSVSLDPPLLLVSIGHYAKMPDTIRGSQRFGLSVLGADQDDISNHFASADAQSEIEFDILGGVPVISGALAKFSCSLHAEHLAGDHSLFIGQILDFQNEGTGGPLLYYAGKYRSVAPSATI